jgi:hypothetical protein
MKADYQALAQRILACPELLSAGPSAIRHDQFLICWSAALISGTAVKLTRAGSPVLRSFAELATANAPGSCDQVCAHPTFAFNRAHRKDLSKTASRWYSKNRPCRSVNAPTFTALSVGTPIRSKDSRCATGEMINPPSL